ncbi:chemotaxis protein CheW [Butyrivibrio fibrisolvens]|uniref:chemotaxis protein CheW n=1 Tax=Pseudobutyrivibrio ruminis TaxID=46206 RepID=UPI00040C3FE0|nr:chemotaxis protein CheW [Pseudobutyrivibrio ruminis]MDC7278221.1 chemotaxis protein CheW [Butyrivibrio fibrisolvens]
MSDLAMYDVVEKEKKQYIVVKIGGEHYGIDISYIDNIVRLSKITRVPKAPLYYRGVINLRGEVVPVMSLRRRMDLDDDEFTDSSRIIILKLDGGGLMGVIVDEVKEVLSLSEDDIEAPSSTLKSKNSFINGVGKNGDELISIFEISSIIGDNEAS